MIRSLPALDPDPFATHPYEPSELCKVCERPSLGRSYRCGACRDVIDPRMVDLRGRVDRLAWLRALRRSWDPAACAFRCYYTAARVGVDKPYPSPLYLVREHRDPRIEDSVVVASSIINQMKLGMKETEFSEVIAALASVFRSKDADLNVEARLLISRVKADLEPAELRAFVRALDEAFSGRPFDQDVLRLVEPGFEPSDPSEAWLAKNR